MGDNDDKTPNGALRVQTENISTTPRRIPSPKSFNGPYQSSPIITPSGSTLQLPSSTLTPLPSPLVSAATFPSNLSLDLLLLGSSPRRKAYGLGVGGVSLGDKRNVSDSIPIDGVGEKLERSVSSSLSGRTITDDGLRREELITPRSRNSSVGEELFDLEFWRTLDNEWVCSSRRYVRVKALGRGAFSKVVLCEPFDPSNDCRVVQPEFLAIKVVRLEPTFDASADRLSSSAKRELEILKKISHPCISHLLAYKELPNKCLFGLAFSPGGDLFDFASRNRPLLTPPLVKLVFRELCEAVRYLHEEMHIVHRDLKLENVLLNYPASELTFPEKCPAPVIALTDLGLSRPFDPESPLLTTRCGSTDYAAPEIMLGQPYDGRATDAWALGVILYCLLESRLPFDPPPDARRPGKVAHRIAIGQWKWYRLVRERRTRSVTEVPEIIAKDVTVQPGGMVSHAEGEGTFIRGGGVWEGGMEIVEGLLRRKVEGRWSVREVLNSPWLK